MVSYPSSTSNYTQPPFDPSTPPPPPPKPPHETNTAQTPHSGPPLPPLPPATHSSSHSQTPSQPPYQSLQILPPTPQDHWLPPILLDKPTTALAPLLSSPSHLTALAQTNPSLTPSPLPPYLHETSHLATYLSTRHAHLLSLRHHTQQHLLSLHALERAWRSKQRALDEQLSPWSAKSLYLRLGKAEKEGEDLSKALEESWMEGNEGDVEGFLRRFREGRKAVGRKREMRERWDEGRVGGLR